MYEKARCQKCATFSPSPLDGSRPSRNSLVPREREGDIPLRTRKSAATLLQSENDGGRMPPILKNDGGRMPPILKRAVGPFGLLDFPGDFALVNVCETLIHAACGDEPDGYRRDDARQDGYHVRK